MLVRIIVSLLVLAAGGAHAAPDNGWWWNPAEGGRGFFIEIQDDQVYIGAYAYAQDGRAEWIVSQGRMASPTLYSGRLLSFRGGQTLVGDYRAPGAAADVGPLSVEFTGDRTAILTWPGGSIPIERFGFDASAAGTPPMPKTGWWWNPAEGGTGFSIEVQGSTLFVVGFMYDASGNPVWYYSAGRMTSESSYSGPVLQFANGQAIGGAYRAPNAPVTVGTLSIDFTTPEDATLTLSDNALGVATVAVKRSRSSRQTSLMPTPPQPLPARWTGILRETIESRTAQLGFASTESFTAVVRWDEDPEAVLPGVKAYAPSGTWRVKGTYRGGDITGVGFCESTADTEIPIAANGAALTAHANGGYTFTLRQELSFDATGTCTVLGVRHPLTARHSVVVAFDERGSISARTIAGAPTPYDHSVAMTTYVVTDYWHFFAVP